MMRIQGLLPRAFLLGLGGLIAACTSGTSTTTPVPNLAPVAVAGADQALNANSIVVLDGSGSHDDDGSIASYAWSQISGAPAVTLTTPGAAIAGFTAPAVSTPTVLGFRLTVTDDQGATGTDDVLVTVNPVGRIVAICLDPSLPAADAQKKAQDQTLIAFFNAREGDTLQFCEGHFDFTNGLVMTGKRGITIKGAGRDKTLLRFKQSGDQDGISINRVTGITIQDLTIYDAPGNGLRIFRTDYVTIQGVKVGWTLSDPAANEFYPVEKPYNSDPTTWTANGSYAFYPVLSHKILIDNSISVGSSDAGVYVGQSSDILVRNTEAYHNVAGFEFENTYRAEFVDDIAHDNVGGFLVFDLPGRAQFGEKNLVHHNHSFNNNIASFAPRGAIVGDVPSGTGMLVLASDQLEVYDNLIENNNTVGLAIVNYGLVDTNEADRKYDFYPEGIHVYNNTFTDNAGSPQLPQISRDACKGDPTLLPPPFPAVPNPFPQGVPGRADLPTGTGDLNSTTPKPIDCMSNNASLLPAILVLKNGGRSAHIIWDGGVDPGPDAGCTTDPVDRNGVALTSPDAGDQGRYEARADERSRPNYYIYDPAPTCTGGGHHYFNKWKFNGSGALNLPQNGLCIENNTFGATQPQNMLVPGFANVHFSTADPTNPNNLTPASNTPPDPTTNCPTLSPVLLPQTVPQLGSFTPNPASDPAPTDAQIAAACGVASGAMVNDNALAHFNCPRLDQYNLFQDKTDPTRNPNGRGVPFDLNTILFSDYAVKYRFAFLPVGQKAVYVDRGNCHEPGVDVPTIFDCNTATLQFPVGTTFAKTFAFRKVGSENVVETRLLIKRAASGGGVQWVGMAYEWADACPETGGTRCARLKIEGDKTDVTWDYDDENPAAKNVDGTHPHYAGSTNYGIPNAGACLLCHSGDDREPGAAPIGPKVRNLNKDYDYGGATGVVNQLAHWHDLGLIDLPTTVEAPLPKWNVPGSANATDPAEDEHMRARAFLEVNCMHCHNSAGYAQNSGLGLDATDALLGGLMGEGHGICKPPTAAGKAAENAFYDIQAGNSGLSLLPIRLASAQAGIKMPPLARTVPQMEAVALINHWVDNIVTNFADPNSNTCAQSGTALPPDLGLPTLP